ncbi:glycoside hydrolase, partial [Wilcoxina mikolae CBS 423.85]
VLFTVTAVDAAFDLTKNDNLVLYWGQDAHGSYDDNDANGQKDLLTYCKDSNVDLISIGLVTEWNSTGGQPVVNFAGSCRGYKKFPGTKLLWCPTIADDIQACQALGKKVLITLGGGCPTYKGFNSTVEAEAFADKIWQMFGKAWSYYRPFGEAVVDGFNLDIETLPALHYEDFAARLRNLYQADTTKKYYLVGAPQCPIPDAELTTALTKVKFDAIFVQFYNNPNCAASAWNGTGSAQDTNSGFNFGMWDKWVRSNCKNRAMKIFLSLVASPAVAPAGGYVSEYKAADIIADLARFPSFAGAALWDASETWVNPTYVAALKTAL